MDKLPEPEFEKDRIFPRKLLGVEKSLTQMKNKYYYYFAFLSLVSIGKYYRDITFYDKKFMKFFAIATVFGYAAHSIAEYLAFDPFYTAAMRNNQNEEEFIKEYGNLLREAKKKNIEIPDEILY